MTQPINVGIAKMVVSEAEDAVLSAPHLGSCLGIAVFDVKRRVGGLIHCLLPMSKSDPEKAKLNPCMYVDTGVAKLLDELLSSGSNKKDLEIYVAGGAQINDASNVFQIGKKNITVLRKILWKNNLLIKAQDVGADYSRTISLAVGSGEVWLRAQGKETKLQ